MHAYPFKSVYTFENNFCGFCTDIVNAVGVHSKRVMLLNQYDTIKRGSASWNKS